MNYYEILDVPKDADATTLKKAYRRKSKACHPDRKGGDVRAMVWVNKAYETLSDPEKRAYYDACGEEKPLTSLEQLAKSVLFTCFLQSAAQSGKNVNVISATSTALSNLLAKTRQEIIQHKAAKENFASHAGTILIDGEDNELARVLTDQIQTMEKGVQQLQQRTEAIKLASALLKKYRSTVIERAPESLMAYFSSATSAR